MIKYVTMLTILFLSTSVLAIEDGKNDDAVMSASRKQAIELLKKVDAAAKAVDTAKYHSLVERGGPGAAQIGKLEGDVWLGPMSDEGVRMFRVEMSQKLPGSDGDIKLTVGCDGDNYYFIDYANKMVYADLDPVILGRRGQLAQAIVVQELAHRAPFSDEINGKHAEIMGSEKIGGVDCDIVSVGYANGAEARWWFAKTDRLPRQREDAVRGASADGAGNKPVQIRTVTKLEIGVKFGAKDFDFTVPDGFKKTDEPATMRVPVQ